MSLQFSAQDVIFPLDPPTLFVVPPCGIALDLGGR